MECYHPRPMSHQPVIDGLEFARAGAELQGEWPVAAFARLRGSLASADGALSWSVRGASDAQGRPCLELGLRGKLRLVCQRCLEEMDFPVAIDSVVILAASAVELEADQAELGVPDRVLARKDMAVRDLLEDELLLAVPYAPRHESCAARPGAAAQPRVSPFSGLRGLVGGKDRIN